MRNEGGTALGRSALDLTRAILAAVRAPRSHAVEDGPGPSRVARES
jgi:hypothetical protein